MYKLARNQHYTYDGRDDRYIKYGIYTYIKYIHIFILIFIIFLSYQKAKNDLIYIFFFSQTYPNAIIYYRTSKVSTEKLTYGTLTPIIFTLICAKRCNINFNSFM